MFANPVMLRNLYLMLRRVVAGQGTKMFTCNGEERALARTGAWDRDSTQGSGARRSHMCQGSCVSDKNPTRNWQAAQANKPMSLPPVIVRQKSPLLEVSSILI